MSDSQVITFKLKNCSSSINIRYYPSDSDRLEDMVAFLANIMKLHQRIS